MCPPDRGGAGGSGSARTTSAGSRVRAALPRPEARALTKRGLALREKARGPRHNDVAETLLLLAGLSAAANRLDDAGRERDRAATLLSQNHAPDRREALTAPRTRSMRSRVPGRSKEPTRSTSPSRASWDARRDRASAVALVRDVDVDGRLGGGTAAEDWLRARVRAWLAARR